MMNTKTIIGVNIFAIPIGIIANIAAGGNLLLGVFCHLTTALGIALIIHGQKEE